VDTERAVVDALYRAKREGEGKRQRKRGGLHKARASLRVCVFQSVRWRCTYACLEGECGLGAGEDARPRPPKRNFVLWEKCLLLCVHKRKRAALKSGWWCLLVCKQIFPAAP
jgi:hypothetical protein